MRIICHLDMDAFFAAIAERDYPQFTGKPIVIGADPLSGKGRGVVSTANYAAREYGIHSAMPITQAWELSEKAKSQDKPAVIFMAANFEKYERSAENIRAIVKKYASQTEITSIDEICFDLSSVESYRQAEEICQKIKSEIKEKERLTCSIGVGPNKLVAKIASDFKKPDGLTVITEDRAEKFLEPLNIRKLPGIGPKSEATLNQLQIYTIRDLKRLAPDKMVDLFGKWGEELYRKARAIDDSPLETEIELKSIGENETFEHDSLEPNFLIPRLQAMAERVFQRFKAGEFKGFRTIVLTVRFKGFITHTRSQTLKQPLNSLAPLFTTGLQLLLPFFDKRENPKHLPIRLLGLRIEHLE